NGELAWSGTVSAHDVNDVYLETLAPCPPSACVTWGGAAVPIETFTEELRVGALGTITSTFTATYERVPHHGPVIPEIDRAAHRLVPRPATRPPMSIRYTGYEPTFELRAIVRLMRAGSVAEGFHALSDFTYGSQNWTMIDNHGSIGWTTQAAVPARAPSAYAWNATTNPDGAAPFFVLPGDGSAEWQGLVDARYIPHAIDPPRGFIATANSDPVGETFDGDPLDGPIVDGRPLFLSATYAAGVRTERIAHLIEAGGNSIDLAAMAAIQHDTSSTVGAKLTPYVRDALAVLDGTSGAPPDVAPFLAALSADDLARLATARGLLDAWTYATPTALDAPDPDSAATALFNTWMHFFLVDGIGDEYAAVGFDMWRLDENLHVRTAYALLSEPATFVQSATTGQPILCDRYAVTGPDDSCTKLILTSVLAAMHHLESPEGFGSADTSRWRWGQLHRLTLAPLFPNANLELPARGEEPKGGFPKAGDNFVINRADQGWKDLDFAQDADGPAQRFLATSEPGRPISFKWQLPTGVIYDKSSPHYRDLLDMNYLPQVHFDAPYLIPEIVRDGETRWLFE
ncbi:MAG TPA: penicillin acylase family protein, partial [Kofleriaceae bacterium]